MLNDTEVTRHAGQSDSQFQIGLGFCVFITVTCLRKSSGDWYNVLNLGKLLGLVSVDLERAFDTAECDFLCRMLQY